MKLECQESGRTYVIRPLERRMDARCADELRRQLGEVIAGGREHIVLDISNVDFIDSSALGAIVASLKALGGKGDLVIAGARAPVMSVFKLARLDRVFRMFPSPADAVAAGA